MTNNLLSCLLAAMVLLIMGTACNDPVSIDTGLLQEDQLDLEYREDITLTATSIREDSVLTYSAGGDLARFPCGNFEDPFLGKTTAEIFAQLRLPTPVDFQNVSYDSIVLSLAYDDVFPSYGDISQQHELEIYRLTENMDSSIYYSSRGFETEAMPVGTYAFTPAPTDSVELGVYLPDTIITMNTPPHIRISLDDMLGEELIDLDSVSYSSNADFVEAFKGINVRPTSDNDGLVAFNLASQYSRLTLYYTSTIGTGVAEYNYFFTDLSTKTATYSHDYTGSVAESFIDNTTSGDSLVFAQGMSGLNAKVSLPNLSELDNTLINKAELEFYAADIIANDTMLYPPTAQFIVAEENEDGTVVLIEDVNNAIFRANLSSFGGGLTDDSASGMQKYTVNITTHLQGMIDGTAKDFILIRAFPKESTMSRSIIYGPGHSTFPMKLKVTYTNL